MIGKKVEISDKPIKLRKHSISEPTKKFMLPSNMRWYIFTLLGLLYFFTSVDQGVISGSTADFARDFHMTSAELGGFGGMVFIGNTLGCILVFCLINTYNRKFLLIVTVIIDVMAIFGLIFSRNLYFSYFCRILTGLSDSFTSIYAPVWTDQFGIYNKKSLMLSLLEIFSAFGYMGGYSSGILLGWKVSLHIQNFFLVLLIIIILLSVQDNYFSMTIIPIKGRKNKNELNINNESNEDKKGRENKGEINNINEINDDEKESNKDNDEISLFEDIEDSSGFKLDSIFKHIKILFKSPLFILINICLISTFLVVSAIQFWINDYLENPLQIKSKNMRLTIVGILIVTGPFCGIICGGIISSKLGGYENKNAIYIPLLSGICIFIMGNIIPLADDKIYFSLFLWIFLFFGSLSLPVANGMILSSVSKEYSGSANSLSKFIINILGRIPGPNIYGITQHLIGDKTTKIPMWITLNISLIGLISISLALHYNNQKYDVLKDEEYKKEVKIKTDNDNVIDSNDSVGKIEINIEKSEPVEIIESKDLNL